MTTRVLASVLFHPRGAYIQVTYGDGTREHLVGNQVMAAELANRAGLVPTCAQGGAFRWVYADPRTPVSSRL